MGHRARLADEGLHTSEALCEHEQTAPRGEFSNLLGRRIELEAHDPTEAVHLARRELVVGMSGQSRMITDEPAGLEPQGDRV